MNTLLCTLLFDQLLIHFCLQIFWWPTISVARFGSTLRPMPIARNIARNIARLYAEVTQRRHRGHTEETQRRQRDTEETLKIRLAVPAWHRDSHRDSHRDNTL